MENKDTPIYKKRAVVIFLIVMAIIFLSGIVFYFSFFNQNNRLGNISSYYLPVFSFGGNEFPPLEFS